MSDETGQTAAQHLMLAQAHRHLQNGNAAVTVELVRRLLTTDPELAQGHALLALALLAQKRLHAADYEAGLALQLDPEMAMAHLALGHIRLGQRRLKEAEEEMKAALALEPDEIAAYLSLSSLYRFMGRRAEALELLEKALALDPSSSSTMADLSTHYLSVGQLARAKSHAQNALEAEPEHVDALVAMGSVLLAQGDPKGAREHAIWALTHQPSHSGALHLLATVKARESLLLGLWWRYNSWVTRLGSGRQILVLLGAYLAYRVADLAVRDSGSATSAQILEYAWLAIVVYTWVGPGLFQRSLAREMDSVRLKTTF